MERTARMSGLLAVAAAVLAGGSLLGAGTASAATPASPDLGAKASMVKVADVPLTPGTICASCNAGG